MAAVATISFPIDQGNIMDPYSITLKPGSGFADGTVYPKKTRQGARGGKKNGAGALPTRNGVPKLTTEQQAEKKATDKAE